MPGRSAFLKFERNVRASASEIYHAFTNATYLRLWLCDVASVMPQTGGRIYLWWNSGYYAVGEFLHLLEGKQIEFSYSGRGEPGVSRVTIKIDETTEGCSLQLVHSRLGDNSRWKSAVELIRHGWEKGLENLASVLESGADLRIIRRPMLGITFAEFDKTLAEVLNVPVKHGLRVEGTVEGMGARDAGLVKNDVIVEMAGKPVVDYPSLVTIVQNFHAGDRVEIGIYRGPQKIHLQMILSPRPIPKIPSTAQELADALKKNYQPFNELDQILENVEDTITDLRPGPKDWSVKENLAHLILSERDNQAFINDLVFSQIRVSDGYADNLDARIQAVLKVYPTINSLLMGVHQSIQETIDLVAGLPDKFVQKKTLYWYLAFTHLQPNYHIDEHLSQIRNTLAAVTSK